MRENILAKECFGSVNIHQDQVGGPQVPLLGHGDEIETPNWACRDYRTHDVANDEVTQPLQGGQGQVCRPQVPLLGHGDEMS